MNIQLVESLIQVINSLSPEERTNLEGKLFDSLALPSTGELMNLAQRGGTFDFLHTEPDLYTLDDGDPC